MVSYDMQDFGGLEEYAVNLAIGLKQQGHEVLYMSAAWVNPENQYADRLRNSSIRLVQPPKWISHLASDWITKEHILHATMLFLNPLTFLMGLGLSILKRRAPRQAWTSAYNWTKGLLMDNIIGYDYRKHVARILLNLWNVRWHPDVLHIQGYTTSLLFAIDWAYSKGVPVAYEEHQTPDPQFNWWKGFESTINKANRVIAVSEKSAEGLRNVCKVTRPIVVRNPLLPDPYREDQLMEVSRSNDRVFTITTVARLYVTKGLTYLLDAAALVKEKYPDVVFKVYGEGELRGELIKKAEMLGLDGDNIFSGSFTTRAELTRILMQTDIFLLSSILEGQPLAIVEAMAHGCPVISTAVGGVPELITDGVNGLLCPPEKPQCLADKIYLLLEDEKLRQRLGNASRAFYKKSPFGVRAAAEHFLSVYGEMIEEKKS